MSLVWASLIADAACIPPVRGERAFANVRFTDVGVVADGAVLMIATATPLYVPIYPPQIPRSRRG